MPCAAQPPKLPIQWSSLVNRLTLCLHASWIFVKKSQDPMLIWKPQRYVPVPEHNRGPLMLSRCALTRENSAWDQPALLSRTELKLTLPLGPTTITSPLPLSHLPVSCLGITVFVADAAAPVTIAASTSRARTSPAPRS